MKTILITGHTSRVGKVLVKDLETIYSIIGISRTTGYDLTTNHDINKVIDLASTVDHVLNLANVGISQTKLLQGIYDSWISQGKDGKIISFSTLATSVSFELLKTISADTQMIANKLALEKMHNELCLKKMFGKQPRSTLLRFANFGERTGDRINEPYTTDQQMIEIVNFVLRSKTYISTIDFREIE